MFWKFFVASFADRLKLIVWSFPRHSIVCSMMNVQLILIAATCYTLKSVSLHYFETLALPSRITQRPCIHTRLAHFVLTKRPLRQVLKVGTKSHCCDGIASLAFGVKVILSCFVSAFQSRDGTNRHGMSSTICGNCKLFFLT